MKPRCYFCDAELEGDSHPFKIGPKEEMVCEECYLKAVNRRKAKEEEGSSETRD